MNTKANQAKPKTRLILVPLATELHKKVRIWAVETDQSIQDWVVDSIRAQLEREARREYQIRRS
jgi:hypothetical protein